MPNFDEAVLQQPDGTTQRLSATEFFKVPLQDRVKLLWQRKVCSTWPAVRCPNGGPEVDAPFALGVSEAIQHSSSRRCARVRGKRSYRAR